MRGARQSRGTQTGSQQPTGDEQFSNPASQSAEKPPLVLIAEDDEPISEAIAFILEDFGCISLLAANGRERWSTRVRGGRHSSSPI
jgi:hypothetical protein